jgi:hypothetical protein
MKLIKLKLIKKLKIQFANENHSGAEGIPRVQLN